MKIKIKYSYKKNPISLWSKCQAEAYRRFGIFSLYTAWGSSFSEARENLITWLYNWKEERAKEKARNLEFKLNPPPPTEVVEI